LWDLQTKKNKKIGFGGWPILVYIGFRILLFNKWNFGILSDSILVDLEKKHLRTQHQVRLFHWRLPNRAQLAAKRQPRETPRDAQTPFSICTWIRGLAALAPWNRLKIYKSHLRNLANTPPFVEVQPNLQKKGSMLYRCQQIHLIYKQTIQTSIQQID